MTAPKRHSAGSGKRPAAGESKPASASKPAAKPAAKQAAAKPVAGGKPAAAPKPAAVKQPPRGQLIGRLHKALKAVYKPFVPNTSRPLLEQTLFACCLQDAPADVAERALARLLASAFDLNEIRVTTVAELAETLHDLPDPARAALALRRVLQGVFESTYTFSLEHARKHSTGHGVKTLEHIHGIPPFVVHYVATTGLGSHAIPLDRGAMAGLFLAGIASQEEYDAGTVVGLERLISKKPGIEFSSLLHQFGVDCLTNLHGSTVRKVLQAMQPFGRERFPKRGESLPPPVPPAAVEATTKEGQRAAEAARQAAEEHRPAGPQAAARPAGKTPLPPPGAGPKRTADGRPAGAKSGPKPFVVKTNVGRPITIKPELQSPEPASSAPVAGESARKPEAARKPDVGRKPEPVAKPAAARKPEPGKPPESAKKPAAAKRPEPAKKPPERKPAAKPDSEKRHSADITKRKPR